MTHSHTLHAAVSASLLLFSSVVPLFLCFFNFLPGCSASSISVLNPSPPLWSCFYLICSNLPAAVTHNTTLIPATQRLPDSLLFYFHWWLQQSAVSLRALCCDMTDAPTIQPPQEAWRSVESRKLSDLPGLQLDNSLICTHNILLWWAAPYCFIEPFAAEVSLRESSLLIIGVCAHLFSVFLHRCLHITSPSQDCCLKINHVRMSFYSN